MKKTKKFADGGVASLGSIAGTSTQPATIAPASQPNTSASTGAYGALDSLGKSMENLQSSLGQIQEGLSGSSSSFKKGGKVYKRDIDLKQCGVNTASSKNKCSPDW